MGARIEAMLEYGWKTLTEPHAGVIDLRGFDEFRTVQNLDLITALTGYSRDGAAPFRLTIRGTPPDSLPVVVQVFREYEEDEDEVSWSYYREIMARFAQMQVNTSDLPLQVRIVLNLMASIEELLGEDTCRLVYTVTY